MSDFERVANRLVSELVRIHDNAMEIALITSEEITEGKILDFVDSLESIIQSHDNPQDAIQQIQSLIERTREEYES
nr:MAG TPA: hypothetical protein [Bacteriophage sp.]DAS32283.1 MAG TPA: hypothetical protein [Caudoviricetes sp.]